ncbi:helix-turn-helix domain-containing protein [Roseovarius sp. EL26]|uniref:winged helix-turn-helix transcriptional regulator n=1 Tax=Roseovarius sp. EL26 TaxID=2126672 RepID=UPI000EA18D02|nr:helix-turn-helix domain-containing protein [Roseovarius sp. EL26]
MLPVTALTKEQAEQCPVRQVLSKVTGKWQLLLLFALEDGSLRFGALKRTIGDITQRVLTENLRSLERDGYLTRTVDPGPPVAVHYELTDMGQELTALMKPLAAWAMQNHDAVQQSRKIHDAA